MSAGDRFRPVVCVVGFHHARGPEIETWLGVPEDTDPATDNDWAFLPFMALADGAHTSTEDFSYFTLRKKATSVSTAASLFGMSCTRQLDAKELFNRPEDVTRSTVQKSVVVVARSPHLFAAWREKLSLVTRAWFMQKDFTDMEILKVGEWSRLGVGYHSLIVSQEFQDSLLVQEQDADDERDPFIGLSLREFIFEFKHQALVLFKCCLLQPKMLFFGSKCERLCMMQFALISLIPGLIRCLEDCADPELDSYEKGLIKPSSLRTSERNSLLAYMGLPLQIFGKGSLFGPYTPLQQLDLLADFGTKSYIVGSTNSLLLQQKDRYSDIIINLDDTTLSITSSSLRAALGLTPADRRWIDFLLQTIVSTWDSSNPSRPRHHGYLGSEEFIRLQFEEYLLALLAATKYHQYLYAVPNHKRDLSAFVDIEGDPSVDFGEAWLDAWKTTNNFQIWSKFTDSHLFDIVDPRHPTAGGLSIDDVNRRITQQIQDLHLDERLATSREALNKHLASGQKKVSTAFNNLWADIESRRAAQRDKAQSTPRTLGLTSPKALPESASTSALPSPSQFDVASPEKTPTSATPLFDAAALRARAPDLSNAQAAVGAAGQRAGAYLSSWGAWAKEQRRGWAARRPDAEDRIDNIVVRDGSRSAPPEVGAFAEAVGVEREEKTVVVPASPRSPKGPRSPRKIGMLGRGRSKEEMGSDGIGRLDA